MTAKPKLVDALNELLEAERAGARVTLETSREAHDVLQAAILKVQHDEAHWCAVLLKAIERLDGAPSPHTGAFHAKAMAIPDISERLAFLNRGQRWVVRRLEALLPAVDDARLRGDLTEMMEAHRANIELMSGLAGTPSNGDAKT